LGPCSFAVSLGSTEWQAKHRWNTRSPRALSPVATAGTIVDARYTSPQSTTSQNAAAAAAGSVCRRMLEDREAVGAGFRDPGFTLAAEHLAHIGPRAIARETLKPFDCGIEAHDGVGRPV